MPGWVINRASVSSDFLEGEVVAIHLGTGIYYSLRGSAATIWQALITPVAVSTIVTVVTAAHEVDAPTATADVEAFLQRLRDEQLIIEDAFTGSGSTATPGARGSYAPPVLDRFSDLQDLLLLDPIHDVGAQGWPHRPSESGS